MIFPKNKINPYFTLVDGKWFIFSILVFNELYFVGWIRRQAIRYNTHCALIGGLLVRPLQFCSVVFSVRLFL